jgi:hypothetical protein
MKKLATLFAMTVVGLGSAWAQGQIDFHNPGGASGYPMQVRDASGAVTVIGSAGSPLAQGSVRVGLFIGDTTVTAIGQMTMVGMVTNSTSPVALFYGTFNGGTGYLVPGRAPNSSVNYAFAAWSISTGALTYDAAKIASTGYAGESAIGQNYTLGGFGTPPSIAGPTFGTAPGQIQGFTLNPVPEPSTIVLGLLGAAGLLFRRRK